MTTLKHHCSRCGERWKITYPSGAVVDPECPNCGHRLEVVRHKKPRAWVESISSELA